MRLRAYVLYGFGIVCCIGGVSFLAAQYVNFLSEPGKLACLLLMVAMFGFLGKYFEERGW